MEGKIWLHRKLLDSYVFTNEKTLKIWIWLLLKARYKDGYVSLKIGKGERTISLRRGQLVYGRHKAEESLRMDGNTIDRHLKLMADEKMIVVNAGIQFTIITVCNYDSYNSKEEDDTDGVGNQKTPTTHGKSTVNPLEKDFRGQVTGNQRAGNGQVTGTNNKDNKDNKNKEDSMAGKPPTIEIREKEFYKEVGKYLGRYPKEMLRAFYDYWTEKNKSGTKMKFETEKTWETEKRLNTWASRDRTFGQAKPSAPHKQNDEFQKLVEKKLRDGSNET